MHDDSIIMIPETEVEVIRSEEEFVKAVMESGAEFGKIHKPAFNDTYIFRNK